MRTGPRILVATFLLCAALCSPARAADSLRVFVDNYQIALGGVTTLAAHADTDAAYGGGHIAFKYKSAAEDCAPTYAADTGTDASTQPPQTVAAGAAPADVGGQTVQLGVGGWRICGWLIDDANGGATVATGSAVVTVVPYLGSISISVQPGPKAFEVVLSYSSSSPAHLYATAQKAAVACARTPAKIKQGALLLLPRGGRFIGSDGGLGRAVPLNRLSAGRWRVCAWLQADGGAAGPVTKTFAVPRQPRRRGGHAAG